VLAAGGADKAGLDIRKPDMIGPAIGADRDVAAMVVAAVDQHIADAGGAQFGESDFLREGGMVVSKSRNDLGSMSSLYALLTACWLQQIEISYLKQKRFVNH
jgi:hypothetical protein